MAKYLELLNDNNNVVIDDLYDVPMLLSKVRITTSTSTHVAKLPNRPANSDWLYNYAKFDWSGVANIGEWSRVEDMPFIIIGDVSTPAMIEARLNEIALDMVVATRSISTGYGVLGSVFVRYYEETGIFALRASAECELQDGVVELVAYTTTPIKPTSPTLAIFDEMGKLTYDVRKPPMVYLGSIYGDLNLKKDVAGIFNFNIPSGVIKEYVYVTSKAGAPYYSAYKIGSGGVSMGSTSFKTVITYPSATQVTATIRRVNHVAGSSGKSYFGGFFENLIYCPYPLGSYI